MTEKDRDTDPRIPPPPPRQPDASLKGYLERANSPATHADERSQPDR